MIWVIILNWNGWQDTQKCLQSLRKVNNPSIHVLVIDNGSSDGSLGHLEKLRSETTVPPFDILATGKNLGFGGGMNRGIIQALNGGARWVLLLNNDTTVDPHFLEHLLSAAEEDHHIGFLNPKILLQPSTDTDPPRIWFAGSRLNLLHTKGSHIGYGETDRGQYDEPPLRDLAYATGGCLLVRRELIDEIGLIPEAYFMYYEDVEWSLHARHRGWRSVLVTNAIVWHAGAASSKEHSETYIRYHVRNGLLLSRRTGNIPQILFAYILSILRAGWQLPKFFQDPPRPRWARAVLQGIADAWRGKEGQL